MAWIGIECGCGSGELERWGRQLARMSAPAAVVDFMARAAALVSGRGSAANADDRMREIEARMADDIARKTAAAVLQARKTVAAAMAAGADVDRIAAEYKLDGWRGGAAAGDRNGGVKRGRRKRRGGGDAAYENGVAVATAERGRPAVDTGETLLRDARYGDSFDGWCAAQLVKMGFKMRHVARGVGLDVASAWRCLSGYGKHWKRQQLLGRVMPEPPPEWKLRLEEAVAVAEGRGTKGRCVVMNGTRAMRHEPDGGAETAAAAESGQS